MAFLAVVDQVIELLRARGRVTYRALKREFKLDDDTLEDVKTEIIDGQELAVDKDGKVLVWVGDQDTTATQPPPPQPSEPPASTQQHTPEAERRQLTVMFADLVGSTALSENLDPEELREVVRAYQQASATVIERYEGYIAQYLGDGLLVYFGYPTAHEDDAIRAVRAGLEIVAALQGLNPQLSQPIQVRIGIHTGQVVIGEMGGGERREQLALGETPNIAARVQSQAQPDDVFISVATSRLVAGFFELEDRGSHELKGISTPQPLYRVVTIRAMPNRFEASTRSGLTPLVGREAELQFLHQRWEQARAGQGQAVLLSGEAGIGKSRLVQSLQDYVQQQGATRIVFRCSPYHQNSALYPITSHLERLLQFEQKDTPDTKLTKLRKTLASYQFPDETTLPLLAVLLSLPQPDGIPPLTFSPQKHKEKTQEVLVRWLLEEADKVAICTIWEDLHWADPSTLELLTVWLDQIPTRRMFALFVSRPEFIPPWGLRSYLHPLSLSRLNHAQIENMVAHVTGGRALPVEVVQQVAAKTDGVPLFVEELTKMVVESEMVRAVNHHYELTRPLSDLAIPTTVRDSLMARLDRLGTAKEVAQLGATIGREFHAELIGAVSRWGEDILHQGLRQLMEAELIYQHGFGQQAHFVFKHALVQDTAYQSLLKSTRRQYHQQIAEALERRFSQIVETQPELLAHHFTQAGLGEQAIPYWQQAGQRAVRRSAHEEALKHLTTGLELLKTLPEVPTRLQQELAFQATLGPVLMATKGYASADVEQSYARAQELCQQMGETPQLFPVMHGLWAFNLSRAKHGMAHSLGEQLLKLAQSQQDPVFLRETHVRLGMSLFYLGELASAYTHLEQGLPLGHPQASPTPSWASHPGVVCLIYTALVLRWLGYPDQASKRMDEALTLAQELSLPYSLAYALDFAVCLYQFRREPHTTQEQAEETMRLSTEQGFALQLATATILRGWAVGQQGQEETAALQIRQGIADYRSIGAELCHSYHLALLAEVHGKVGRPEAGLTVLAEALAFVDKTGERYCEAELCRLKGELLLLNDEPRMMNAERQTLGEKSLQHSAEAEACFRQAIEVARGQRAKSLELCAAISLVCLWQKQGKNTEGHQLLSEIYGWFTEGLDTPDLIQAKKLLEELS